MVLLAMAALGWLLSAAIPGCIISEDGGIGCIAWGIDLNWPVFILGVGGLGAFVAWCLYLSVPCLLIYWLRTRIQIANPSYMDSPGKQEIDR